MMLLNHLYLWCLMLCLYLFCPAWRPIASFVMPRPKRQLISLNIQLLAGFYFLNDNVLIFNLDIFMFISNTLKKILWHFVKTD